MPLGHLLPASAVLGALVALTVAVAPAAAGRACEVDPCRADIDISGHAEPQPIYQGETSEFKFTAKNDGYDGAFGIDLQATIPYELKILSVTQYGGRNGCTVTGTFLRCDFGDFRREQEGVVRVTVCGTKPGTYLSPAKVYSSGVVDPNGGNNQVTATMGVLTPRDSKGSTTRCGRLPRFSGRSGGGGDTAGVGGSGGGSSSGSGGGTTSGDNATTMWASDPQRPLSAGGLLATITAGKAGHMIVTGEIKAGSRSIRFPSFSGTVTAGQRGRVKLQLSATGRSQLRQALKGGKRLRAIMRVRINGKQQTKTELHLRR